MVDWGIEGLKLNVSLAGERRAPALILAHPLGANLQVWDDIAPALAEKFFLVRLDLRGHGRSRSPAGPYALADFGGDVCATMDALGVKRAHFLGQSMGGAIGQWLMIHAPERLDKIVLANTASYFPSAAGWNARIRSAREKGMTKLAPSVAQRWLTEGFRNDRPDVARKIEHMLLASDPLGYAACCSALRDTDLRDAIRAAPPRPVLVIVGESDASTPPELGVALAKSLSDSRLVRLKAAHLSSVEAEEAFLEAVTVFLAG
ncbi:3-oxoadipate enol-lactonase [uncultured Rhodoblastus sp.]|uniref:3-oxoadipate enol-lactonase n=1 Tax=uncultured Rhodoblastus sp. TaxID=543037 RepID=UPI0025DDB4DA|nr:3-oxoadipate enol-lactonase [uncultured Rhodoblastus sp.]